MNEQQSFKRLAASAAILAGPVSLASAFVLLAAVDYNTELMSNPAGLITVGATAAKNFRWGSVLELGAPTLLLVPAAFYLWSWLKPRASELVSLYTFFGLSSLLLAAIGSLLRATLYPTLMSAYPQASETQQEVLKIVFQGITDFTFEGLYALELIFLGIWWLGIGLPLRNERHSLGIVTAILGIAFLGAGIGWLLGISPLPGSKMRSLWCLSGWCGWVSSSGGAMRRVNS